jgi:hypothetical protein
MKPPMRIDGAVRHRRCPACPYNSFSGSSTRYGIKEKVRYESMYEIYTDGSCLGNPGAGGWGAIGEDMKLCGAMAKTTNNIMEMTAVAKALEECVKRGI